MAAKMWTYKYCNLFVLFRRIVCIRLWKNNNLLVIYSHRVNAQRPVSLRCKEVDKKNYQAFKQTPRSIPGGYRLKRPSRGESFWIYNLKALSRDLDLPFSSFNSHPVCQFSLFQIIAGCICPIYSIILFFLPLRQDHVYVRVTVLIFPNSSWLLIMWLAASLQRK